MTPCSLADLLHRSAVKSVHFDQSTEQLPDLRTTTDLPTSALVRYVRSLDGQQITDVSGKGSVSFEAVQTARPSNLHDCYRPVFKGRTN